MNYKIKFLPQAKKEWDKLDSSLQTLHKQITLPAPHTPRSDRHRLSRLHCLTNMMNPKIKILAGKLPKIRYLRGLWDDSEVKTVKFKLGLINASSPELVGWLMCI